MGTVKTQETVILTVSYLEHLAPIANSNLFRPARLPTTQS
jgi:hypothetical protein